ncbi:hypothetical protein TWF694_005822 [Orbilia ellipsospora]|uniref:DUF2231 domain-containing protein n=1 Tax=Orbilia ellipsospora TaxID=2528407 RepID=A0AAV9WS31_9PEZI
MFKTHPLHPALVHFPISFLTATHTIDILHYLTTSLSLPILTPFLTPHLAQLLPASRLLHTLGIATALPAALSGILQAAQQLSNPANAYESDGKTFKRKFLVMFTHAALMDTVVAVSGMVWWWRFKEGGVWGLDNGGDGGVPSGWDIGLGAVVVPVMFYGASLGADLVYKFGMGFSAGSSSQDRKRK